MRLILHYVQAGEKDGCCGWRWCLQQLTPPSVGASGGADRLQALADGDESEGAGGAKAWDPAKLLRSVLQQVDVHK
jgi:hypothetical protein